MALMWMVTEVQIQLGSHVFVPKWINVFEWIDWVLGINQWFAHKDSHLFWYLLHQMFAISDAAIHLFLSRWIRDLEFIDSVVGMIQWFTH